MKLTGGEIDVTAGTGFRGEEPVALVRLTVSPTDGEPVRVWLRPLEARAIGLDLIGAAHASIADTVIRRTAKRHGLDGDDVIGELRLTTTAELGPG